MAQRKTPPATSPNFGRAPTQLLNEFEAAERLGLSVKTLRRWRWAGRPPAFVKIGRAVRYEPEVIEALIAAGRRVSTTDTGQGAAP